MVHSKHMASLALNEVVSFLKRNYTHLLLDLSRVYFVRDYIFSMVPTKYFAHIPANFFKFDVFVFELWIQLCYLKREDMYFLLVLCEKCTRRNIHSNTNNVHLLMCCVPCRKTRLTFFDGEIYLCLFNSSLTYFIVKNSPDFAFLCLQRENTKKESFRGHFI